MRHVPFVVLLLLTMAACKKEKQDLIVYQDSLATDNKTWDIGEEYDYYRKFENGHYSMQLSTPAVILYSIAPYYTINFPYSVQTDVTMELEYQSKLGSASLIFNYIDSENFMVLEIIVNGTYRLLEKKDGSYSTLAPITGSPAIKTTVGAKNTFKVIQRANNMELEINNTAIITYPSSLPAQYCAAGVAVATYNSPYYTTTTAHFNNFIIAKL